MKTYQKTVSVGELVGGIEWGYDFASHLDCYCGSDDYKADLIFTGVFNFWMVDRLHKAGKRVEVCLRCGHWHRLIDMGMYDGWPFWKPTPAVYVEGPIGGEWHHFPCIVDYRIYKE